MQPTLVAILLASLCICSALALKSVRPELTIAISASPTSFSLQGASSFNIGRQINIPPFTNYTIDKFYTFLPDPTLNFEMNRFVNQISDPLAITEAAQASTQIKSLSDWVNVYLGMANNSVATGNAWHACWYWRAAQFYMNTTDIRREPLRVQFLNCVRKFYDVEESSYNFIPYESGKLPSLLFYPSKRPLATIVLFSGFDGYMEEMFGNIYSFLNAGYTVIAFEGPGQGSALEDYGLTMTPEWEKPVKAVLDFYRINYPVALIGKSLGGNLVVRAGAKEPRATRIIAWDILSNFFEMTISKFPPPVLAQVKQFLANNDMNGLNQLLAYIMSISPSAQWAYNNGMHVFGVPTPADFIKRTTLYDTAPISQYFTGDAFLMAGAQDNFVDLSQLFDQGRTLNNTHSTTMRIFTVAEQAQSHCQVGHSAVALTAMINWLGETNF